MKGVAIVTAALVAGHHCTTTLAQTDSLVTVVNVNAVSMDRDQVEPGRTVTVRGDRIGLAFDAIRTATVNPSQFLGMDKEFGTIAVGKRADLLLIERNPLEDAAALNQPLGVMVRERWLPRETLQSLVSTLR
jgi:cytosine/adenosine deaminase-related metal-dependent hydrolase